MPRPSVLCSCPHCRATVKLRPYGRCVACHGLLRAEDFAHQLGELKLLEALYKLEDPRVG